VDPTNTITSRQLTAATPMPLSERLGLILLALCSLVFVVTLNLTPVFNSYAYGDQLVYHFYPKLRVTIDSRVDAYGEEYYRAYRRLSGRNELLFAAPTELLEFLDKNQVQTIVVRTHDLSNWVKHGHASALVARA